MHRKHKRILLKFGSGILTRPRANALDEKQFRSLAADVAQLVRGGCECIIVSSGAVAAGMRVVGLRERPVDLTTGQAWRQRPTLCGSRGVGGSRVANPAYRC